MTNGYPSHQALIVVFKSNKFCVVAGTVDEAAEDYQDELTIRVDLKQSLKAELYYNRRFLELLLPYSVVDRYFELKTKG
jgi:hypothetical protein